MATYAIGDVQGCFDELTRLLERIGFDRSRDRLWFVGDLVNRGPKSLEVLRFVKSLGEAAVVVLGNHDLHLAAAAEGLDKVKHADSFQDVLAAPDRDELLAWLRARPLMHAQGRYAMVHAGLLPQWTIGNALSLAAEVEAALRDTGYREFFSHMYGGDPRCWDDALAGWERLRAIVNAMTRMRFCTPDGRMEFKATGAAPPAGFRAWFDARPPREEPAIVCGHWSALGLKLTERLAALDTGCVWGGSLSALRLEDRWLVQVPCKGYQNIGANS
jgi:bis(5'-nucleosyl)-tetraphosphatase (symmetrical)